MKKQIKKLPIRTYTGRSHLLVGSLVLIMCSLGYIINDIKAFRTSLNDQLKATSNILSYNLIPSLQFKDEQDSTKILKSLATEMDISNATVFDREGKLFSTYGDEDLQTQKMIYNEDGQGVFVGKKYYYEKSILQDGQKIGSLVLVSKFTSLENQYLSYLFIVSMMTFACLFLAFLVSVQKKSSLSKPIEELLALIKKVISTGDYSVKEIQNPGTESSIIEIENLWDEFNHMMNLVYARDLQIKTANDELEKKVEEKTASLMKIQLEMVESSRLSSLGEMASGIAHEINNPLTVIIGKVGLFKARFESGKMSAEEVKTYLEKIENMAIRISKIIRGLKNFSRDGEQDPFESIQLKTLFEDAMELCGAKFKNHGTEIKLPDFKTISVDCRSTQLGQVILNLLNNAFDAIQEFNEKWIQVDYKVEGERLQIMVTDSGKGIPPEIREKMMNPFFTTKGVGKGTGLGLSISIGIIEKHGGKLYVDAQCPNTRFVIDIPMIRVANKNAA